MAVLAVLAALLGTATAPSASADSHAPTVVSEQWVGERLVDLIVRSPAMGADVPVRLLVPEGWEDRAAGERWPVLYLLHGRTNSYTSWTQRTDVEELDALRDTLVVMPEAGPVGWYSNWWNGGLGGPPAWETFHMTELRRLIEDSYGASGARAVAGLSMGGLGALNYAARYPGAFRAAASYSGIVDTQLTGAPELILALTSLPGVNPLALWGHPVAQASIWAAHNPSALAGQLRGTRVFLSSGNGLPGPLDPPGAPVDPLEAALFAQNAGFAQRLVALGVPVTADFYGAGRHDWPYWERELHRSLPLLLGALDNTAAVTQLHALVTGYRADGRISVSAAEGLLDRLRYVARLVEQGSETRTIGYLEQFVARAENRIRRDDAARDALVAAAEQLIGYLLQEEQVEARPPLVLGS